MLWIFFKQNPVFWFSNIQALLKWHCLLHICHSWKNPNWHQNILPMYWSACLQNCKILLQLCKIVQLELIVIIFWCVCSVNCSLLVSDNIKVINWNMNVTAVGHIQTINFQQIDISWHNHCSHKHQLIYGQVPSVSFLFFCLFVQKCMFQFQNPCTDNKTV